MGSCKNFLSNKRGSCFSQLPNNVTIFYLFSGRIHRFDNWTDPRDFNNGRFDLNL